MSTFGSSRRAYYPDYTQVTTTTNSTSSLAPDQQVTHNYVIVTTQLMLLKAYNSLDEKYFNI